MKIGGIIRRLIASFVLFWALGFLWFTLDMPEPTGPVATDAVVVPTGGQGRIARGLEVLKSGQSRQLLISGVDREVQPAEFVEQFAVDQELLDCCITLGFRAVDTRSNAAETAQWVKLNKIETLRLVTTDWHMRRAANELARRLPDNVIVYRDAVPSDPDFGSLFLEYHKLLASWTAGLIGL